MLEGEEEEKLGRAMFEGEEEEEELGRVMLEEEAGEDEELGRVCWKGRRRKN